MRLVSLGTPYAASGTQARKLIDNCLTDYYGKKEILRFLQSVGYADEIFFKECSILETQ